MISNGKPFSPALEVLFMDNLENSFILPNYPKFLYYFRYVNDILEFIDGSDEFFNDTLNSINQLQKNVQFTVYIRHKTF